MADRLRTEVGPFVVSTVPLLIAIDGMPWERMVLHPDVGWADRERFATWKEAERDHMAMVERLRNLVAMLVAERARRAVVEQLEAPAAPDVVECVTCPVALVGPPESVSDVDPDLRPLLEVP